MSQNESTPFLVMDAKNLTLIDATRENLPWCGLIWPRLARIGPVFPVLVHLIQIFIFSLLYLFLLMK